MTTTAERGSGKETEGRGMTYKYRYGARYKDFNKVRGDVVREMTAIKKEDDADVVEKTPRKLPVTSPILQHSCKKTASDCWIMLEFNTQTGINWRLKGLCDS